MFRRTNQAHLETLIGDRATRTWPRPDRRRLIILFTPRSGSSWLGDLLLSTRLLGEPDEYLNQDINADLVRRFATGTELDYLNAIETETASANGVFSMEMVWGHVELSDVDLLDYYRDAHFVYLRRHDILAQAVSLFLTAETGVFHNATGAGHAIQNEPIAVDAHAFPAIRRWWGHLQNYECLAEVQLAIRGINPLRLMYEHMVQDGPGTAASILALCGIPPETMTDAASTHKPMRSAVNDELANRFRAREAEFIRVMESFRPPVHTRTLKVHT